MSEPWKRKEVIGDCTLYLGDCHAIMPTLGKIDAIVTDPPYGMNWNTDSRRFSGGQSDAIRRKHRGVGRDHKPVAGDDVRFDPVPFLDFPNVVLWGANHFQASLPVGTTLVWLKKPEKLFGTFLSDAEIGFAKGGYGVYCHYKQFPPPARALEAGGDPAFPTTAHPTQKPVSLMAWCIERFGSASRLVLDPFMGSGTTGVASIKTGRRFIGIEIDEGYFEIACDRIRKTYQQTDMFLSPPAPARVEQGGFAFGEDG